MILLTCPFCGPRDVGEFAHQGEVVARPDPRTATPAAWREYLYLRQNPAGVVRERWFHRAGCRRFFDAARDTTDNAVHGTWALGADPGGPPPETPPGPAHGPAPGPAPGPAS